MRIEAYNLEKTLGGISMKVNQNKKYLRVLALLCGFALLFQLLWGFPLAARGEEAESLSDGELYAYAAVLMDAESGRVLYEKRGNEKLSNASTTKIMTCITVLEEDCLGETAEASLYASAQPKVHLGVSAGETFRVEDLLYSLMLESHNDSAVVLAEHIGAKLLNLESAAGERSVEESKKAVSAFAARMNEKAREIGCKDTTFVTPNGLDAVQVIRREDGEEETVKHGTTAEDLALIMAYCVTKSPMREKFLEITRTNQMSFSDGSGSRTYSCQNHNAFLSMMDGALSGKTGFTNSAGYCYVGALQRDGRIYTIALLACGWPNHKTYKWSDSRKLFEFGLSHYDYREFLPEAQLPKVQVENGQSPDGNPYHTVCIEPCMEPAQTMRILCSEQESMVVEVECQESLQAPVHEGDPLGSVTYFFLDQNGGKIPWQTKALTAGEDIPARDGKFVFLFLLKRLLMG